MKNLTDAPRLHTSDFHAIVRENQGRWISERIEGPNIANVFKRTFYQMMLKFQIGAHPSSAGCVLALPAAVWDSWQRHLGKPELTPQADGTFVLSRPKGLPPGHVPAWILVFDLDADSSLTPNPIILRSAIATDADSVAIRRRPSAWWPALTPSVASRRRRSRS